MHAIRVWGAIALVLASAVIPRPAAAQQEDSTVYTYVAEFRVAPANRSDFVFQFNEYAKPVLDRLLADGTISEWGRAGYVVHTVEGMTDLIWWCSDTVSGTQKVLDAVAAANMPPSIADAHQDALLQSVVFRMGESDSTTPYVYLSQFTILEGKTEDWMALFNKYNKPVYEKLLADGTIIGYGIDFEYVHTADPRNRYMWVQVADAEAMDKVDAAFDASREAMSPEERRVITSTMLQLMDFPMHRDGLIRAAEWRHR